MHSTPPALGMNPMFRRQMVQMAHQRDQMEQYDRCNNLIFKGFAESREETEDLEQVVIDTANSLNVNLLREEIDQCFRIGKQDTSRGPRRILVRLKNKSKKVDMMKKKKNLDNNRYLEEDLTKMRSSMFYAARKCPKTTKAWTIEGKIFAYLQTDQGSTKITLSSPEDMKKIGWTDAQIDNLLSTYA